MEDDKIPQKTTSTIFPSNKNDDGEWCRDNTEEAAAFSEHLLTVFEPIKERDPKVIRNHALLGYTFQEYY